MNMKFSAGLVLGLLLLARVANCEEQRVAVTGTVDNLSQAISGRFNVIVSKEDISNAFKGRVVFDLSPITVTGIYNGPYPWYLRVYTDNQPVLPPGVADIPGTRNTSKAGLMSVPQANGYNYIVPLKVWCIGFGPAGHTDAHTAPDTADEKWGGPECTSPEAVCWQRVPDKYELDGDKPVILKIEGIDPTDRQLVTGHNPLGDFTINSVPSDSYSLVFAAEFTPTSIAGDYSATELYVEVYSP